METEEGNISAVVHVRKAGTAEMVVLGRVVPGNDKTVDNYRGVLEVHTNTEAEGEDNQKQEDVARDCQGFE